MARWGTVNVQQYISITHWDGRTDLYPTAHIFNSSNTEIGQLPLYHRALGFYSNNWTPAYEDQFTVVIITYSDSLRTVIDPETQREGETFFINSVETDIEEIPNGIADQVWDEVLPGQHDEPFTSGLFMQVIRETVLQTNWEIKNDPEHSLTALDQKILDNRNIIVNEVNENETKIDALSALNTTYYLDIKADVLQNRSDISLVHDAVLTSKNEIINEVNENESKIDAVFSAISQIQNNTRFVAIVPQKMLRPQTGTKRYQFFLAIYDTTGNPEAPDSPPTVKITQSDGTPLLPETTMTQDGVKIGQYYYNYDLNAGSAELVLRIEFKIIENGVTLYLSRTSELIEFDTSLASIESKIDAIDIIVEDNRALLTGGNGLSVLNSKIDNVLTEIDVNETKLDQIKVKTDLIVSNPATTVDLAFLEAKIDSKPNILDIQSRLDVQTDAIQGPGAYNLTDVMNNERGTDNALLANDPRLNFLDAAISSRSGHTVSDVWSNSTRTLTTSVPLSNTDVARIWDYLTSNITTSGSIGKYILDLLDVPVSSRSDLTLFQLNNALAPLALEATLQTVLSTVVNENNENELLLNDVLACLALIKPQTDKIVADGAQQTSMINEHNQTQALIEGLELIVNDIRNSTDNIPNDVARQSSLLQIPTNPLLTNDPRLSKLYNLDLLDVAVSTRAESFPNDYAKEASLYNVKNELVVEIDQNELLIRGLPSESFIMSQLSRLDLLLNEISKVQGYGFDIQNHSLVEIRENLGSSGSGSGGASPEEIWAYGNRSLTDYPDCATKEDLDQSVSEIKESAYIYSCHMTTTFICSNDTQEVLCWLDRNGQTLPDTTNARITISNGLGDIWSGTSSTPDSRGVYHLSQSNISQLISEADRNFVISITIEHENKDYTSIQPFYTVG